MINIDDYTRDSLQDLVNDMDSRIVELEADNERLKESQRWRIIANGELPERDLEILTRFKGFNGVNYWGKTYLCEIDDWENVTFGIPVFWLPVPTLPELDN